MAIRPEALENPERDLALVTRGPEEEKQDEQLEEIVPDAPGSPMALRETILRNILGGPPGTCRACFERGVKAAATALDAEGATLDLRTRIAAVRTVPPMDTDPHYAVDFHRGVEAALRALEEG